MRKLGMADLLDPASDGQRDLALTMIAARVLEPASKLATTRLWQESTLARDLDDGSPVHSWRTLLSALVRLTRNRVLPKDAPQAAFEMLASPTPLRARALELIAAYQP